MYPRPRCEFLVDGDYLLPPEEWTMTTDLLAVVVLLAALNLRLVLVASLYGTTRSPERGNARWLSQAPGRMLAIPDEGSTTTAVRLVPKGEGLVAF
jgi:hypothetical protein